MRGPWFGVWGLGLGIWGLRFRFLGWAWGWGLGFGVSAFGFWVGAWGLVFGLGLGVWRVPLHERALDDVQRLRVRHLPRKSVRLTWENKSVNTEFVPTFRNFNFYLGRMLTYELKKS